MKKIQSDPFKDREAEKYDNPIPSREFILDLLKQEQRPLSHVQLCSELGLVTDEQIEALRRRLRAMERDGQLIHTRRGGYGLVDSMDLIRGRVQGHRDGFGFLVPDDGSDDLYLHNRQMRRVFDGDKVVARVSGTDRKGRREGSIIEVIERNTQQLVGRLQVDKDICYLIPENRRICHEIFIAPEDLNGADDGQYVLTEIVQQPGKGLPRARVLEALGDHMAPGMEIEVAIRNYEIPSEWPAAAAVEAKRYGAQVDEADKTQRVDMRARPFVTIDGEDAKDFDDAVLCEPKKSGGWRLFVAIADVSHYVRPGSALDEEALSRATSVYFPGHVVPMLPESLSNGLCSLNPQVDRLAMVCEMTISAKGKLSSYNFYEAVIRSHARLTYTQVGALLEAPTSKLGRDVAKHYAALIPQLHQLHALYKQLRVVRTERGAIDFETVESRIEFGAERKIERIVPVIRNDAHKLIEECMLCANVATARFLEKMKIPALYRVHKGPRAGKLENLRGFIGELGLDLGGGDKPTPGDYQRLMERIQDRPDGPIVQTMMLRSLSQAVYSPDNEGHFGLAYPAYAHFTSPIRRYPDLLVHRAIRSMIRSGSQGGLVKRVLQSVTGDRAASSVTRVKGAQTQAPEQNYPYDMARMLVLGEQCSMAERRADEATRDVTAWLKCEYMQDCIGQELDGVVNAVTGFGLFVELIDIFVEGLVHVTALPSDYYHFDAGKQRLTGERTRESYRLGDRVRVRVVRVDLDERKIDFELIEKQGRKRGGVKKSGAVREQLKDGKVGGSDKGKGKGKSKEAQINALKEAGAASTAERPEGEKPAKRRRRRR